MNPAVPQPDQAALEEACREAGIAAVYLFGSALTADQDALSDIDLGVLFSREVDLSDSLGVWARASEALQELFAGREVDVTAVQLAPPTIQFQAISGRVLYCGDDDYRTDFEDDVLRHYLDWQVEMEMFHREVMEEIRGGRFLAKQ